MNLKMYVFFQKRKILKNVYIYIYIFFNVVLFRVEIM